MDWKIFVSAFGLIFLAELGDKTQLAAMVMAARSHSPLAVFLGAMAGFGLLTLIGVAFGSLIMRFVPEAYVRFAAGGLFILFGILILLGKGWK
ncbi:MAG: TMEM165/GDT1 family protein [Anaerolineae bacterium]|jgi:putative Ca2+/H+ antiporter (TMEM165/GDT1 family)|nr:TMEM165/GDT1 family protein [Anaerolineae bacterium]